jgi:transposase InsO family protein
MRGLAEPKNGAELLRFLGVANYFGAFIEDFANRSKALYEVLSGSGFNKKKPKGREVVIPEFEKKWGPEQRKAWGDLKADLSSPEMLVAPTRGAEKKLLTDASSYGVGAVLLQEGGSGDWKPVAFAARKLKGAETRYTVTEQECLAVVFALRKWRHYLHGGKQFEVVTDHVALKWLLSLRDPRGRLARWVVEVQDFDFRVSHAPGSSMVVPDCLSRDAVGSRDTDGALCPNCRERFQVVREPSYLPTVLELQEAQTEHYGNLDDYVRAKEGYIVDEDGLLCREGNRHTAVLVPPCLRPAILSYIHGSPTTGHFGIARTSRRLASRFWWPGYRADVSKHVAGCLACETARKGKPPRQGQMVQYHPTRRFELVAVDILEISPRSRRGNSKLLVIGDTFSRFAWAHPIKDEKVETVTRVLLDGWFLRYGPPEKLLSDRGKVFASNLLARVCEVLGIRKIFTSAYHPQTDGFVERLNRTLCRDLSAYVTAEEDWDEHVAMTCFRYNTSVHEVTGVTPFEAMFGVPAFDFDATIGWKTFIDEKSEENLSAQLQSVHDELYRRGKNARSAAAKQYDKAVRVAQYDVGDRVLLFHPPALVEEGRKLRSPWLGPYVVTEKLSPIAYILRGEVTGDVARVHVNRLRRLPDAVVETDLPQRGVYPDTRRLYLRILDDKAGTDGRLFKLASPGRNGFVWKRELELPEVVVKLYDLAKEDRAIRWGQGEEAVQ